MDTGESDTPLGHWDPEQYVKFRAQRAQPFFDLAKFVRRAPGMQVVDLGCGTGELTEWLHGEFNADTTLGVDLSAEMLSLAAARAQRGLRFTQQDIRQFAAEAPANSYDLIYSNAALQWVDDHASLIPLVRQLLAPGGQLAVQIPWRSTHPASAVLPMVLAREPYASALKGYHRVSATQSPDFYATQFHSLGAQHQRVEMHVYGHVLPDALAAVEWLKGSALTPYRQLLSVDLYRRLIAEYESAVVAESASGAYFMPFNRILMWADFD